MLAQFLALGLAVAAYAPLLRFDAGALDARVESWLFIPSDSSTVAVLVLAAWLLLRRAGAISRLPAAPARLPALFFMALGIAIYAWASLTRAGDLLLPSLAANGIAIAIWHRGLPGARAVLVPTLFLSLALPIPPPLLNEVVFSLQLTTAEYAGWLLRAMGEAVFISGDQIIRVDQQFQVIEGCSGMRSMETLTMLAVLLLDLFRRRGLHAALVLLAAPPVAFALNGLRVIAVILLPHSEIVAIHTVQGVGILLGGLVVLYALDGGLDRVLGSNRPTLPLPRSRPDSRLRQAPVAAGLAGTMRAGLVPMGALGLCLAIGTGVSPWPRGPGTGPGLNSRVPTSLGNWQSTNLRVDRNFLGRAGNGDTLHRQYRNGPDSVQLFLATADRRARDRSPFSPTTGIPGSGWDVDEGQLIRLGESGPEVRSRLIRSGTRRMLVFHWYEGTDGLLSEVVRSALALDSSPFRRLGRGLAVRIATPLSPGESEDLEPARRRLIRFYEDLRVKSEILQAGSMGKTFS